MYMFRVEGITKRYDNGVEPIRNLNATIHEGDVIALIGPSGTGKSTFLRCLNMLDPATSGSIYFEDEDIMAPGYDVTKLRIRVGMVFQSFNLFNHLTVIENIMMPQTKLLKRSRQEAFDKGIALLDSVGLKDRYLAYPAQLSGGQKQRVAIARTMAMDPEVLLLDEPTSALDPTMVDEVKDVIRRFVSSGVTTLIVTHDMGFAREISNRIFYMDEGVVYEEGTPGEIFENPKRAKTLAFVRKQAVVEADIYGEEFDFYGFIDQAAQLEARANVSGKVWTHAMLVLDEIVQALQESYKLDGANALPHLHILFMCGKGSVILRLSYGGERYNMAEELEKMAQQPEVFDDADGWHAASAKIILSFMGDISYAYNKDEELSNQLEFSIC